MCDDKIEKVFIQYPCAKVGGIYHVTISGTETLCGIEYRNSLKKRFRMLSSSSRQHSEPLRYKWWHEIGCEICKEKSYKKMAMTLMEKAAFKITI